VEHINAIACASVFGALILYQWAGVVRWLFTFTREFSLVGVISFTGFLAFWTLVFVVCNSWR
jgi:hypothetical protein